MSKFTMSKTYEVWTQKAIQIGETNNRGFEYEDKDFDSLYEIAEEIRDNSTGIEPSSSRIDAYTWYSTTDAEQDYRTGALTNYGWHPDGLSKDQMIELWRLIKLPQHEFSKSRPE